MKTYTIKIETMFGIIRLEKSKGKTVSEAIDALVRDCPYRIGNILEARDSRRRKVL